MSTENETNSSAATTANVHARMPQIKPPKPLDLSNTTAKSWKLWKQMWQNYSVVARLDTQDDQYQKARLLCAIGEEALEVYNAFEFEAGQDSDKVSVTIAKFGDYFTGDTNETYERFKFNQRSQADGETFDNYLTELKHMRKTCNFCQCLSDSLLRDRIVLGIRDDIA